MIFAAPEEDPVPSWVRDATLTTALAPQCLVLGGLGVSAATGTWNGGSDGVLAAVGVVGLVSVGVWILVSLPAALIGAALTRHHPFWAAAFGLTAGAVAAAAFLMLATSGLGGGAPAPVLLLAASAGVVTIGPPWVAYVAVRHRGRSGLPIVGVAAVWCLTLGAALGLAGRWL